MISYLLSVLYPLPASVEKERVVESKQKFDEMDFMKLGGYIISENDLKSVKLTPPRATLPLRQQYTNVDMRHLSKSQLDAIMSVKLKPIPKMMRLPYEVRHPCLRELLQTRQIIY
jgi:hypothetical protein